MKVILTGGTGFIGSYVLMQLLAEGHEVTLLARNAAKVPAFTTLDRVQVVEASMTDFDKLKQVLPNHDACIHVALNYNGASAYDMLMSDTATSIFLATEAAKAGISHFIYTSSTAANDHIYSKKNPIKIGNTNCHVTINSKQNPHSYYGATKAATENFLMGIAGETSMRVNIIRPGYTFGNPVMEGAFTQPDRRFHAIVQSIVNGEELEIIKHDGTQFIWGGDLAKIYTSLLNSNYNRHTYFGLSTEFTSWHQIAVEAKKLCNSTSSIVLKDLNWSNDPILFDVSDIEKDFKHSFLPYPHITNHLQYLIQEYSKKNNKLKK